MNDDLPEGIWFPLNTHTYNQSGLPMLPNSFDFTPKPSAYEQASKLLTLVRKIEMENAELRSKVAELETLGQGRERSARVELNHLQERIRRRIKALESKLEKAAGLGDLAAAAQADARLRALTDLLDEERS